MKKTKKSFGFIMFAGKTKDDLYPISAWQDLDEAIEAGRRLLKTKVYKYIEITYMPEDDNDVNEIVWASK